jgi:hypothetical protein
MRDASPEERPRTSRLLRALVWLYAPISMALAAAALLDDKTLLGESVWVKPLKFSISIGLNGATFVWLLARLERSRLKTIAAWGAGIGLAAEQVLITMQAARGVRSHFNNDTGFDSTVYGMMGNFVGIVWLATLVMAIAITRRPIQDRIVRRISIAGTWLVLLGSSVGFLLVAAQKHSIGGVDGGPILPFVGWNRNIGDLRPAHFVGLHALQVLIVIAWGARRQNWTNERTVRAITAAVAAIGMTCVALVVQAFTSRPVASPSTLLIAVVSAVAGAIGYRLAPGNQKQNNRAQLPNERHENE